jgi:hypothetical protein
MLSFAITAALLSLHPDFRIVADRRSDDLGRYVSVCAFLYQRPTTLECVEVRRG